MATQQMNTGITQQNIKLPTGSTQSRLTGSPSRGHFGELLQLHGRGESLLADAIKFAKLPNSTCSFDRKGHGNAMNYDYYDCLPQGAAVIVQQRWTTVSKYGNSSTKNYFLIRRCGKGVVVTNFDTHKPRIVKLAKASTRWGQVIEVLIDKTKKTPKPKPILVKGLTTYKVVETRNDTYWSVFDKAVEWPIDKCRIEAATHNHAGGFYCYATADSALKQLQDNVVFNKAWLTGKLLALVECEVSGRMFEINSHKLCVTKLTVKKLIQALPANQEPLAA